MAMTRLVWYGGLLIGLYLLIPALLEGSWFKALLAAALTVYSYNRTTKQ
jgi:hypothetical protein